MKLTTPFKVWIENPQHALLFIQKYSPDFRTISKAYYWCGSSLAHQYDDRKYFDNQRYKEIDINKLIEINYEIF